MIIKIKPVGKGRPRFKRVGQFIQTYTPTTTKNYEKEISKQYINNGGKFYNDVPLSMNIEFYFAPNKSDTKKIKEEKICNKLKYTKKPDIDNLIKSVLDSLNGIAYNDDSQIIELTSKKMFAEEDYILIEIKKKTE